MKLSIITINFNNKDGLRKTIESVVSQTYKDYEYIIIDGASTDGSIDVIKEYEEKITYWISEPDKGIYNAMNKGILQAQGEYCLFLNSGDWLVNSDTLYLAFKDNVKEDMIVGNIIKYYSKGHTKIHKSVSSGIQQTFTLLFLLKTTICHQACFIKRQLFETYGLYNEKYKITADWVFFLISIGVNGCSVNYKDIEFVYYDMNGLSEQQIDIVEKERAEAISEFLPYSILSDYNYLLNLEKSYNYVFRYKTTYYIASILNKIQGVFYRWTKIK